MRKSAPTALAARFYLVGDLVSYLHELIEGDPTLSDEWVSGEICDLTRSAAGHVYFTIRDEDARIPAVMFRSAANRQTLPLMPGVQALIHGAVGLYDQRSTVQLIADVVLPGDAGRLQAQFEAIRMKLEEEGLFAEERKRLLPRIPQRIGIVTSESGAVIHDMLNVWNRRYPHLELVLAPSTVQGDDAPRQVVSALRRLYDFHQSRLPLDLIILARGGGSPDELSAFNDEQVARAVFASPVPLVSAIGHEVDYTIVDFVADLRAPTPSAAAEMVVPEAQELCREIERLVERLRQSVRDQLGEARAELDDGWRRLDRHSPERTLADLRREVDELSARGARSAQVKLALARARHDALSAQLAALGPETTLKRGYAIVSRVRDGRALTDSHEVDPGQRVSIRLAMGSLVGEIVERN
jgi:exodeoxyribonuclease VII large subunit